MSHPYDFAWLATAHALIPEILYSPSFPIHRVTRELASYDIDAWERNHQEYMASRAPRTTTTTWPSAQTHPSYMAAAPSVGMDSLLAALTTLAAGPTFTAAQVDLDRFLGTSVPVRPTATDITNGTTVSTATEESDCAICQDTIQTGHQTRKLNACEHKFHRGCIDQWLYSHVTCPVCRHDLREPAATSSHSAAATS